MLHTLWNAYDILLSKQKPDIYKMVSGKRLIKCLKFAESCLESVLLCKMVEMRYQLMYPNRMLSCEILD